MEASTALSQSQRYVQELASTTQASHLSTSFSLHQLGDKVQDLHGMSTGQSEALNQILELLKQNFPTKDSTSRADPVLSTNGRREIDQGVEKWTVEDENSRDAVYRLCQLANEAEKTVFSEDAEAIIQDLEKMLAMLDRSDAGFDSTKTRRGDEDDEELGRDMKRIKGFLYSSHCVEINEKGRSS